MLRVLAFCLFAAAVSFPSVGAERVRSRSAIAEFKRTHPCPANGARSGPCGGYVIDHVCPLDCGGADAPRNMQWQTTATAKSKDHWEREGDSCHPYHQKPDANYARAQALCKAN